MTVSPLPGSIVRPRKGIEPYGGKRMRVERVEELSNGRVKVYCVAHFVAKPVPYWLEELEESYK